MKKPTDQEEQIDSKLGEASTKTHVSHEMPRRSAGKTLGVLLLLGLGYALLNRSWSDAVFPMLLALILGLPIYFVELQAGTTGSAVAAFRSGMRAHPVRGPLMFLVGWLFFSALAIPVAGGIYGCASFLLDVLLWLRDRSVALAVAITAVVALGFFIFRLRFRVMYGASEALAGLSIAWYQASNHASTGLPSSSEFYIAILTAGIYLVVRGLDNMHQGVNARSDLLVNWIVRRARRSQ